MGPRPVTLYTIEEQTVMAHDIVSFYRSHMIDWNSATILDRDGVALATTERIDVPVRRYAEALDAPYDYHHKPSYKESFIAIDPKLDWMIKEPIVSQMEAAEKRSKAAMKQVTVYQDRINDYNSLPWYKRIFKKV